MLTEEEPDDIEIRKGLMKKHMATALIKASFAADDSQEVLSTTSFCIVGKEDSVSEQKAFLLYQIL